MSSNRRGSVKKLFPFLVKDPAEGNGNTWMDNKSSSLPNLASIKSKAFPDSGEAGDLSGVPEKDRGSKKQSSILRNFKLKSLSKRHNLTKSVKKQNGGSGKGPVRVLAHENKYDKYPGSDPSRGITDGVNGDLKSDPVQNTTPVIDANKHHFCGTERIGYIKKSPHKTASQECCASTLNGDNTGVTIQQLPIGSDSKENHWYGTSFDFASEFNDEKQGLGDGESGRPALPPSVPEPDITRGSNRDSAEAKFMKDRPPARPPKPLKLRGEPLTKIPESDGPAQNGQEDPPRLPAREPSQSTAHRDFPTIRAVQLLHGNRESGVYESITEPPPVEPEFGLPGELRKLPHQPWYWGPLTQEEAEEKLRGLPDGYFLVRDSSDDRYLLSLSFNSNRRPVHTRFEYVGGQFSINDSQGYLSVVDLIEDAVRESQNGIYSFMQNINGTQTFPARLTNPVSRFTELKSLQHLSRFVIRETFPRHYIADLPVPEKIRRYILENQY